ncbi:V-type proton ATPase 16 kDa proteolipid subunit [Hondaea fermentalgiana]|uniref:V-type proton ATPase 16 kDa proteolipid subunit n=1 Tax=Hondaea fermentalgiana TaxID=2315210 RepID=A0A2R5GY47_9STRA|nr:V-type proton ATPase 16 kDa proteolipid subunit [Hondaea fermentalgiana]|eukprot:GBG34728.1 V-type proton ATPase 16 kDa proteolipid subunit [Hondaea fermentalgiana]
MSAAIGAALAIALSATGSAVGSAFGGQVAIVQRSSGGSMSAFIPIVMAGVVGIYGLITSVCIAAQAACTTHDEEAGSRLLGAGLAMGIPGLVSGCAIGLFCHYLLANINTGAGGPTPPGYARVQDSDEGVESSSTIRKPQIGLDPQALVSTPVILVLIFIEALALYGLIASLVLTGKSC